jgi:kynureninase
MDNRVAAPVDELLRWRAEFPAVERTLYFISHSLGAMPARTRAALAEFADQWDHRSIRAWEEGWWEMPRAVGDLVGRIIGAGTGEVVLMQNVSVANWIVTSCFDWQAARNKIVSEDLNFTTNLYHYHALQESGARLVTVASADGLTIPLEKMLAAIDEQTALVSCSHVLFRSSFVQNLEAIVAKAHRVGALVCADLYQSAGVLPVDVRALGVDFATGGSVKWLCGGPGAGYLYVRRDLWPSLRPRNTGWMAHRAPFDFAPGPVDYATGAFRFLHGTPNVPAMYAARSGYEIILEAGVERIRAKSLRQTRRLMELGEEAGFAVRTPRVDDERGGSVIFDVPDGKEVTHRLLKRDVLVDYRPGAGIRVAPHFYTRDDELEQLIAAIRELSARG